MSKRKPPRKFKQSPYGAFLKSLPQRKVEKVAKSVEDFGEPSFLRRPFNLCQCGHAGFVKKEDRYICRKCRYEYLKKYWIWFYDSGK